MTEPEFGKIERIHKAVDRSDRIVCSDIVLDPRRKKTALLAALAALEHSIRHVPNRTRKSPKCSEFLLSLVGQKSAVVLAKARTHYHRRYCYTRSRLPRNTDRFRGMGPGFRQDDIGGCFLSLLTASRLLNIGGFPGRFLGSLLRCLLDRLLRHLRALGRRC